MRVLICGDRNFGDRGIVEKFMRKLPMGSTIISGGARGADSIAAELAGLLGFESVVFAADWNQYGKRAGPIRNQAMLSEGRPELVVAFHAQLEQSKGTKHMVAIARAAAVPVILCDGVKFQRLAELNAAASELPRLAI